jgi:hypothetical protein
MIHESFESWAESKQEGKGKEVGEEEGKEGEPTGRPLLLAWSVNSSHASSQPQNCQPFAAAGSPYGLGTQPFPPFSVLVVCLLLQPFLKRKRLQTVYRKEKGKISLLPTGYVLSCSYTKNLHEKVY